MSPRRDCQSEKRIAPKIVRSVRVSFDDQSPVQPVAVRATWSGRDSAWTAHPVSWDLGRRRTPRVEKITV